MFLLKKKKYTFSSTPMISASDLVFKWEISVQMEIAVENDLWDLKNHDKHTCSHINRNGLKLMHQTLNTKHRSRQWQRVLLERTIWLNSWCWTKGKCVNNFKVMKRRIRWWWLCKILGRSNYKWLSIILKIDEYPFPIRFLLNTY